MCGEFLREKVAGDRFLRDILTQFPCGFQLSEPYDLKGQGATGFNAMVKFVFPR